MKESFKFFVKGFINLSYLGNKPIGMTFKFGPLDKHILEDVLNGLKKDNIPIYKEDNKYIFTYGGHNFTIW
jgi:hypothetical protein